MVLVELLSSIGCPLLRTGQSLGGWHPCPGSALAHVVLDAPILCSGSVVAVVALPLRVAFVVGFVPDLVVWTV